MSEQYFMGVDFGTMGIKTVIFDLDGNVKASAHRDTPTKYPKPNYAEIDPEMLVTAVRETCKDAVASSGLDPQSIKGIGFSNIGGSIVPIDKDKSFLFKVLPWNDNRGVEVIPYMKECIKKDGLTDMDCYNQTGWLPLPNVKASSFLWLKKNHPDVYEKTWKFVNMQGLLHIALCDDGFCDDTNEIMMTGLANCESFEYMPEWAERYGIDFDKLDAVKPTCTEVGHVSKKVAEMTGLAEGTPLFVGAADIMCGAVGAGVTDPSIVSMTIGTGANVNAISSRLALHPEGKISLNGSPVGGWHLLGSNHAGASSFTWFKNMFCQAEDAYAQLSGKDIFVIMSEMAAKSPAGSNGILYAPWLQGADTPRFDDTARGTFVGLSFAHTKNDMMRSVMEGVGYEMYAILKALEVSTGTPAKLIRIMGGGANSPLWCQIIADICNCPVETLASKETSALAASLFAAIGAGAFTDIQEAAGKMVHIKDRYEPIPENHEKYAELVEIYEKVFDALHGEVFEKLSAYQAKYVK